MTIFARYFSPTTPGNPSFTEDVAQAIRLGSITGLPGEARLGATGVGNVVFDDPTSTFGHAGDGILGLKQFYVNETACPVGSQRVWTGYIGSRTYRRGPGQDNSLRTGAARQIDTTVVDVNDFLGFRVFAPVDVDPTSSFVRPAETDLERVQALLNDVDFLSTTLFDIGYIPSTGGVDMDENDYTGQRPIDVLNDCAQASGRNFWVLYDEADNQLVLWYDDWQTDGSSTLVYDSALKLTNVLAEVDNSTIFAGIDPEETLDPSRLVAGVYLPYDGGTAYGTDVTTSYIYAWRDSVMPSTQVKTSTKADALVARYLDDNSTEDSTIRVSVQLPTSKVTGIHEGMRLQVHFTHLPYVDAGFTWTRVLSRTVRVDVETQQYYWLDLELSPTVPTEPTEIPIGVVWHPQGLETGDMYYSGTGDAPESGWGTLPISGPISYYSSPTPGIGLIGFEMNGTGTINFVYHCSQLFVGGAVSWTWIVERNSDVVATSAGSSPGGITDIVIEMSGSCDVVPGDIIKVHCGSTYAGVVPSGGGSFVERLEITGGSMVPA